MTHVTREDTGALEVVELGRQIDVDAVVLLQLILKRRQRTERRRVHTAQPASTQCTERRRVHTAQPASTPRLPFMHNFNVLPTDNTQKIAEVQFTITPAGRRR